MFFNCPLCSSSNVELAGRTDSYQSLVCHDCQAWSTVPIPREAQAPGAGPRNKDPKPKA